MSFIRLVYSLSSVLTFRSFRLMAVNPVQSMVLTSMQHWILILWSVYV